MRTITEYWYNHINKILRSVNGNLDSSLIEPLKAEMPTFNPQKFFREYFDKIELVRKHFGQSRNVSLWPLPDHLSPVFKYWVLHARQQEIEKHEMQTARTNNSRVVDFFTGQLDFFTEVMRDPDFTAWGVEKPPRLADVLTIERLEAIQKEQLKFAEREYDEKFHILQAPELFIKDLRYFRQKNELRGITLATAFLDIDNFKVFNTELGNNVVDREVLPPFMRVLERHVYGRGYAYRVGGDEYLILLINAVQHTLEDFQALAAAARTVQSLGQPKTLTMSIGLALVDPDCTLTDQEIHDRIEEAKTVAKNHGKNRVAVYKDLFDKASITVHESI